ncbi:L,D-transpeptidase-like protein [Breznakibacter xylanolyticus]|uniref:L,D-transpeptidase-like protein n=1 Tax=Breznakibacter xylanolyticus TaxID=990 RepID=A0A2W7MXE0_9BACT|nr:murein L,D-transpeptidase catalytic domain family protein [Breznakibacter xylanolyticus]PZX10827.1 L,D-transpeptidase-like protein [Breznakibacter xylanolyticus]
MKKFFALMMMMSLVSGLSAKNEPEPSKAETSFDPAFLLHKKIACQQLSFEAFRTAYYGHRSIRNQFDNDTLITIVDFSKPSTEDRFFVVDIKNGKLLIKTLVAHGKNSGNLYAEKFSNVMSSLQSSLGFFKTGSTYTGKHGFSMLLNGLEKGINDKARERAVVVHSADYVSEAYAKQHGRLGRSFGCPALSKEMNDKVINLIKNGSCMFLYHPSQYQLAAN